MPANPKYLEKSNWQRFAKITAGIIGGYAVSFLVHAVFLFWFDKETVNQTAKFSLFLLWMLLLILPFLFKNGWKCWAIYIGLILVLTSVIFFKTI